MNQRPVEAFPALGGGSAPSNPQWVHQKPKKQESRLSKVAPAPALPPSDLSQFPVLSKAKSEKAKKSSSVTVPVSGTWASNSSNSKTSSNNNTSRINKNIDTAISASKQSESDSKSKNKKHKKKSAYSSSNGDGDIKLEKYEEREKNFKQSEESKDRSYEQKEKNGIVKKRSELNIGSLTLNDNSKPQPPPGFPVKPPPGFNVTNQNFPSLTAANDLTFTSSSGQSYSIKPSSYHQPTNFVSRNQNLIKRSMNVLNNDMIKEFKTYSTKFRDGDMAADQYYEYCRAVLGPNFKELFPELLVLLPDVEKQQELYRVCDADSKKHLVLCENCSQVVFKRELREHYNFHTLESQFPSLGKTAETANAWKK